MSSGVRQHASILRPNPSNELMKSIRLIFPAIAFLFVSTGIVEAIETNGFLVFEVGRYTYTQRDGRASGPIIQQRFKVPLTEEFMSHFENVRPGFGFCCRGGNLKSDERSTAFAWWIRKGADNRWRISMWGSGVETINGLKMDAARPTVNGGMGPRF